ncbi:MAG: DNA gyrase inhibitor YacG [Bdellovibrionales bacterium]
MDKTCVVCGKPQDEKYKPFCSARCAQIDLGKWLGERYVVQDQTTDDGEQTIEDNGE